VTTATDTVTAPAATAPATPVKDVRAAEVARLDDVLAASEPRLAAITLGVEATRTALGAARTELAALQQKASTLQQELGAATTGPERHRIELALDRNLVEQGPVNARLLAATTQLALHELAVKRETALAEKVRGDLARADAALTQARQEAASATVRRAALDTVVPELTAAAAGLTEREKQATDRVATLLGGAPMLVLVGQRLDAHRAEVDSRIGALTAATTAVLAAATARSPVDGPVASTAADLVAARAAVQDVAEAAPLRSAAARTVLDEVLAFPDLPAADQAAITAAAAKVPAGAAADVDAWEVAVPLAVTELAIRLLDTTRSLGALRLLDVAPLRKAVDEAEAAHAVALAAQLGVQARQDTAAAAADVARDAITAHEPTAADRRLSLARGEG
jgi:hypothetical protein